MKIGIHGINGKMGLAIAHEIMAHPELELCDRPEGLYLALIHN